MPNAHVGNAYSELIRTSGGIGPFTFSKTGLLPDGLILNVTTGVISGTPTTAGYVNLGLTVTDSTYPTLQSVTQNLGVRTASQITITNTAILPTVRMGTLMNPVTLTAAGGSSPYTWSVVGGYLPDGVTFNADTGTISGTPQDKGDFIFTIRIADSVGNSTGGSPSIPDKQFFLHVSGPLSVTTTSVPTGGVGIPYGATLAADGGMKPYSWSIKSGTLPSGLTPDLAKGIISGTPTAKITSTVTFTVTDSDTPAQSADKILIFDVSDTLSIVESTLPIGRVNQAYTTGVHAQLGTPPYTWRVSDGALPNGLSLTQNAGSATISGAPALASNYTFTLEASDSTVPPQVVTRQYAVTVYAPLAIPTVNLKNAERTLSYSDMVATTGGAVPCTFSVISGALPLGLGLNSTTGVISGVPPALTSQSSTFTIRVTDSGMPAGYLDKQFSIFVTDPVPVEGVCGINGGIFATAPTENLCSSGTPSATGSWNWDCTGLYGGATAHCSATYGYFLTVTMSGSGSGTVQSSANVVGFPRDIYCTLGICEAGYPNDFLVTLTAAPNPTSTFTSWDGSCTGTPCNVTMDAAKSVTATFTIASMAMNASTGKSYSLLSDALTGANSGEEIWTLDTLLEGAVTLDKAINLKGGWNATYQGKSGLPTLLNGDLTIQNGNSSVETIEVKGKLTIQSGSLLVNGVVVSSPVSGGPVSP
jgi:hypothetical protein